VTISPPPVMRFGILTSMSEVYLNQTEYRIHGVRVERFMPLTPVQVPRPIVFVHGGCHGSWSWVHFLPYFAQAGWDCHALNWFGHHGSAPHPEVGLLQRGIADVTEEIAHVASQLEESPVIVAHSMGAASDEWSPGPGILPTRARQTRTSPRFDRPPCAATAQPFSVAAQARV
jgi:triacylglycerol esterase/lipase EstA (alpha/beta hydrolase family)